MIHKVAGKRLSRNTNQRKALLKGLANSVILYEKVETTEAKAKAAKPFIEKLVTTAKQNSVNSRRQLLSRLGLKNSVNKLLEVVGPTFKERPGGYLRLTKLPVRAGDSARMVVIEFVESFIAPEKLEKSTAKKKTVKKEDPKEKKTTKAKTVVKAKSKLDAKAKDEKTRKAK